MSVAPIDFGLAPCTTDNVPDFTGANACRVWLAGLPLTNITQAQAQLLRQLILLNRYPLHAGERLKMLELLREPIEFIQDQCLRRFAGRALPLTPPEQTAFDTSQALWQELAAGYLHCLQASLQGTAEMPPHLAASLAATRALAVLMSIYLDACHAKILPASSFWGRLHSIYQAAEEMKISRLPIVDGAGREQTAASTYVAMLLLAAAMPFELDAKQISLAGDWAQRWSRKVVILHEPPVDLRTPSLSVDLTSRKAASFQQPLADSAVRRWLELSELRKSIKKRLALLARGESPQSLHLGKGCEQPDCEAFLKRIYQCWCKGGLKDDMAQTAQRGHAQLVSGFEAIHHALTGQPSFQHEHSIYLSYRKHEEIATFGRIDSRFSEDQQTLPGFKLEEWRVLDENASSLRLKRPLSAPGKSLVSGQLLAVRMDERFILGKLRWITMSSSQDTLIANIQLLPGIPTGVSLRSPGPGSSREQICRGLFLPEIDQLGEVASLFASTGWYGPRRIIEMEAEDIAAHDIRLDRLLERGADFERFTFEWL